MIEVLFAKIIQLANRLRKISSLTGTTLFGDGLLGNYYIGKTSQITPEILRKYNTSFTTASGNCTIPILGTYNFDNLYIDEGSQLAFPTGIATIRVKDTLYLKGVISVANTISGAMLKSKGCPNVRDIVVSWGFQNMLTDTGFYLTGGTGNTSLFADTPSGGVVVCYYCNLLNEDGENLGENFNNSVLINGSATGNSGGCLKLAANKIVIGSSGYINANGGSGEDTSAAKQGIFINSRLKSIDLDKV